MNAKVVLDCCRPVTPAVYNSATRKGLPATLLPSSLRVHHRPGGRPAVDEIVCGPLSRGSSAHGQVPWGKPGSIYPAARAAYLEMDPGFRGEAFNIVAVMPLRRYCAAFTIGAARAGRKRSSTCPGPLPSRT